MTSHPPHAAAPSKEPRGTTSPVVLQTGFRLFFLGGAAWAVLVVPLWIGVMRGSASTPIDAVVWHAHEMVIGVAGSIIAGFLLTAVRHWTGGERTADGAWLGSLVLLWAAGRVALLPGVGAPVAVAVGINLAFLPALLWTIARPIARVRNGRNAKVLGLLAALWLAQAAALLMESPMAARGAMRAALLVVVGLCVVITGRIVPLFTRNALGRDDLRTWLPGDVLAYAGLGSVLLLGLFGIEEPPLMAVGAASAAVGLLARMRFWGSAATLRSPLLWVLHLGHLWFAVGMGLQALASVGWIGGVGSSVTHALALGGVGTLILGMIVRVTLGHTGRPLRASGWAVAAFVVYTLGVVARVAGPWVAPSQYLRTLEVAAAGWSVAFALYLIGHAAMLVRPRPDGRPG